MNIREEIKEVKEESFGILKIYKEIISDNRRASKRSFIINIVLLIMLFSTNIGWLLYESGFETIAETSTIQYEADTEGDNSPINQEGEIN